MAMKMRQKIKGRPHRYGIDRPRLRHGHKQIKYKMCLSIVMAICFATHKQHLKINS